MASSYWNEILVFDPNTGEDFVLKTGKYPDYPGFTKDGRILFADLRESRIFQIDPNQFIPNRRSSCIRSSQQSGSETSSGSGGIQ